MLRHLSLLHGGLYATNELRRYEQMIEKRDIKNMIIIT